MIPTLPFGRTGHASTRLIFGAAALARASQGQADRAVERLLELGVNHVDTAASYGDSEALLGPALEGHRQHFFLATKTGARDRAGARESLHRSLERLRLDRVDLLQLHNLVKEEEWAQALGDDGALRAAVDAREEGLVRFLGVTGHGTRAARMHRRSLERFPFDSVLLPYSRTLMADPDVAAEVEALLSLCRERGVAVQTIKAIARRRWPEEAVHTHSTWYEPLTRPGDIEREVRWVLSRPEVFLDSASDLSLFEETAFAVARFAEAPGPPEAAPDASEAPRLEPLFVRGFSAAPP